MMYAQKLAVAVKVNGKVLRERGDTVFLPFGSEYSLSFKNLNTVRALVRVEVDGQDATEGTSLIVHPKQTVELERFIKGGNLKEGHRFKFIERTGKVEDHRGVGMEDGLIRVEFEFERPQPVYQDVYITRTHYPYHYEYIPKTPWRSGDIWGSQLIGSVSQESVTYSASSGDTVVSMNAASFNGTSHDTFIAQTASASAERLRSKSVNDVGVTVPGSVSDQKFDTGAWFPTDGVKQSMVLKLLGEFGEQPVQEAVTVKTKLECPSCGTKNSSHAKFCTDCGTGLVII